MKNIISLYSGFALFILLAGCSIPPGSGGGGSGGGSFPVLYVSGSGNDLNPGTNAAQPLRTIQEAVIKAITNSISNIRVTAEVYTPGTGLSAATNGIMISNAAGLNITGGYNTNFSSRTGMTVLDGMNALFHIVWIGSSTNITLDGFEIIRGYAFGTTTPHRFGGGLSIRSSMYVLVTNCVISNNLATNGGGGVYINGGGINTLGGIISGNIATNSGGGVYIETSVSNTLGGMVSSNTALVNGGGGYYIYNCSFNSFLGTVSGNTAQYGGGIFLQNGAYNIIGGTITSNTAYRGGGIDIENSISNTVNGGISFNLADYGGGGVYLYASSNCNISGTVSSNAAGDSGGGIFIKFCTASTLSGTVSSNTTLYYGGGINIDSCTNNNVNGIITFNSATYNGGGVSFYASSNNTVAGNIISNCASSGGGIFLLDDTTNNSYLFSSPVITFNTNYGVYRFNANSVPQGLETVTWGGNIPGNTNW